MKAEDLKSVLRFADRNQTYHDVLRGVGVGAYTCINNIDDAIGGGLPRQVQKPNSKLQQEQVCQ